MMRLQYLQTSFIILTLLVTGCQNIYGQPTPGSKPTETSSANMPLKQNENSTLLVPTLEYTKEPTMEPTSTLEIKNNIHFANIKPGQYLLVNAGDGYSNFNLYVIATSGKIEKKIPIDDGYWSASSDGKQIYYLLSSWADAAQNIKLQQAKIFDVPTNK